MLDNRNSRTGAATARGAWNYLWCALIQALSLDRGYGRWRPIIDGFLGQLDVIESLRHASFPVGCPVRVTGQQNDLELAIGHKVQQKVFCGSAALGVERYKALVK